MATATNIDATAVNTIAWLSAAETTIVVPVYQRQYRWDIGGCEQLLADIRAVADSDDRHMHFIGSVLSSLSMNGESRRAGADRRSAAHHDAHAADRRAPPHGEVGPTRPGRASSSGCSCGAPIRSRTKLRPHRAWAQVFESVVLDRRAADGDVARIPVRRQLRVLPQPDPRRGGAAHLARPAEAGARRDHARDGRQRAADLREPQLDRRAAARSRADPQLRPDGSLACRAERDRGLVLGADRAEHRRVDRKLLAPLPRHDDGPRGRRRRRTRRVRRVPARVPAARPRDASERTPRSGGVLGDLPRPARSRAGAGRRGRAPARLRQHLRARNVPARHARLPRPRRAAWSTRRR